MAVVNHLKKEINAKIVYYGPGLSGKTTNLNHIFRRLKPEHRGKLKLMNIQSDRMLFFDFRPVVQNQKGYDLHLHIYTIIGQAPQPSAWKLLLKSADGIVFVADSGATRIADNQESLQSLVEYLDGLRQPLRDIPVVFQCNKQDLPGATPLEEIQKALVGTGAPMIAAEAVNGKGVLESLFAVVKLLQKKLQDEGLEFDREPDQPCAVSGSQAPNAEPEELPEMSTRGLSGYPSDSAPRPIVELDGEAAPSGGCLRLPLVLRWGGVEEKFELTVSLSRIRSGR